VVLIGNSKLNWFTAHSKYPGFYITFESCDGAGKDAVISKLREEKIDVMIFDSLKKRVVFTREPGGTKPGELVRETLLDNSFNDCHSPESEALGFAYQRALHFNKVIIPCLEKGDVVISSRGFDSSIVFQGYVRRLDEEKNKAFPFGFVESINFAAVRGIVPDLTLFFDIDPKISLSRKKEKDRFENEDLSFHDKVMEGYHTRMKRDETKRKWAHVDASLSLEKEFLQVKDALKKFFPDLQ